MPDDADFVVPLESHSMDKGVQGDEALVDRRLL